MSPTASAAQSPDIHASMAPPVDVPADLTDPGATYLRQARLAMAGLIAFLLAYLGLIAWFTYTAHRLLTLEDYHDSLVPEMLGIANGFFALFMVKALVFNERTGRPDYIEITEHDEPELFSFVHQVVADVGAPRPHRVFLSSDVNAAVFYDLSLLNLFIPTRKNLVIGVGLIQVLSLGEFKAVLAHEFGHFAQRSMAIGRWVYVAQRVAQHIVTRRDFLDSGLRLLSGWDLRIAWIGWVLRVVVWSLRAMVEVAFRLVVLADRALQREMEFQADLVAVSQSGSDAIVHALHRLGAADAALSEALAAANAELSSGRLVCDLFDMQSEALTRLREVLGDPSFGMSPTLSEGEDAASSRVFERHFAQPPQMWSTHPPNHEREANAKRRYVACEVDPRSPWLLFADPEATRERVTAHLYESRGIDTGDLSRGSRAQGRAAVAERLGRRYLEARYQGAYLGRSCVREASSAAELLQADLSGGVGFDQLYPASLRDDLARWKATLLERTSLEGLRDGHLKAVDTTLQFRGEPLSRHELGDAIEEVSSELQTQAARLHAHDRLCRSLHCTEARKLSGGWSAYHRSLVELLHYADHVEADLHDAAGQLSHVFGVVTADDQVSNRERDLLVTAALDLYESLDALFTAAPGIVLPPAMGEALGEARWAACLPESFELGPPDSDNIGDWLEAVDSWLEAVLPALDVLERVALEHLLDTEANIETWVRSGAAPEAAPPPAVVPGSYPLATAAHRRTRALRLTWWDRFYTADGMGPAVARTLVAALIVGAVLYSGLVAH